MRALSLSSGICRLEGARTEARAGGVGARGAARGGPRGRAGKGAAAAEASAAQPGGLGSVPALPLAGQPREANYFLEPPLHHLVYKVVHKRLQGGHLQVPRAVLFAWLHASPRGTAKAEDAQWKGEALEYPPRPFESVCGAACCVSRTLTRRLPPAALQSAVAAVVQGTPAAHAFGRAPEVPFLPPQPPHIARGS